MLDLFSVMVSTNEEYPANKEWIGSTVRQIEADIQSYLDVRGD